MSTAFSYARVSHADSAESDLSRGSQADICRRYYDLRLEPEGIEWSEQNPFYDPAVSARHVPFLERKAGIGLHHALRPGDHVIFAHLDRGFRAILDFAALMTVWKAKRITIHFADLGVDLSTPAGALVANIMASVAQSQSDMISERNKEIATRQRKLNRPCTCPIRMKKLGWKGVRINGHWEWKPDVQERAVMAEIVRLRDSGVSFDTISDLIEAKFANYQDRPYKKSVFVKRVWNRNRCWRAYRAYKAIQADNDT